MPDYVVLISTLGGLATFGLNEFVLGPVIAAMFKAIASTTATISVHGKTPFRAARRLVSLRQINVPFCHCGYLFGREWQ
jgi:hypothetical protein